MTEQEDQHGQEQQDGWTELGIRIDIPHPARVYDYMLGGKDNFAVDREMAEVGLKHMPEMRVSSLENRAFLVRAVRFLRDAGIRQFLDVGTGLPTSPNTYEVAQEGHPEARVVYVDNDPFGTNKIVCGPAQACLISVTQATLSPTQEAGAPISFG